jgi:hypothetical protein
MEMRGPILSPLPEQNVKGDKEHSLLGLSGWKHFNIFKHVRVILCAMIHASKFVISGISTPTY